MTLPNRLVCFMNTLLRNTYVEINLDSIAHNVRTVRRLVGADVAIAAVVKGDGYGCGAVQIAPTIMENGADCLMVATLTEALELRRQYKEYTLIVMGYTADAFLETAVLNDIALTLFTIGQAELLCKLGRKNSKKPVVYIKYDTGMHRIGYEDCQESIDEILKILALKDIVVEGIFSHLAQAGPVEDASQAETLTKAAQKLRAGGYKLRYVSICESIGLVQYPQYHLDMVRPGTILYGIKNFDNFGIHFEPVISFKTMIVQLKIVPKNHGVGYKYEWKSNSDSVIGTLPVGFADGFPRHMHQNGYVLVRGKRAPIAGYVCMDQCMIDLTDIPQAKVGDEVILYGCGGDAAMDIEVAADMLGTTKGEILCHITRRTPRVYTKDGKIVYVRDDLLKSE